MAVTEFLRYRTQPKWFARSEIMATSTPVPVREPKNMGHPPRISGSKAVSGVVNSSNARSIFGEESLGQLAGYGSLPAGGMMAKTTFHTMVKKWRM